AGLQNHAGRPEVVAAREGRLGVATRPSPSRGDKEVYVAVRAPLARVPENTMKFTVGVMLCSFGIFWVAEGAGASWPGGDASLLGIIPLLLGGSVLAVLALRRGAARQLRRYPPP
ncbi:MAG: hypothetical protein ACHP93_03230, partial [Solirubrobacterales bacterium]